MTSSTATSARQRHKEESRQRLLEAGLAIFARQGYERARVEDIAHAAGYSKGVVYLHFSSKENLFQAILGERNRRDQASVREWFDPSDFQPADISRVFANLANRDRQEGWWPLFLEFLAHAARNEAVRQRLAEHYRSWREYLCALCQEAIASGRFDPDLDPQALSAILVALYDGICLQAVADPEVISLEALAPTLGKLIALWMSPSFPAASPSGEGC